MNLLAALLDPAAKDTRSASGKTVPGRGASDPGAVPFPDVLDDVGVETVPATPMTSVPDTKSPAVGPTRATAAAGAPTPPPDAFFEVLVASAAAAPIAEGPAAGLARSAKESADDAPGEATVGHLLKRVTKTLDADTGTMAPALPGQTTLLVPGVAPALASPAPIAPQPPAASDLERAIPVDDPRRSAPEPPAPATAANAPRLSEVAVATQFAPIAQAAAGVIGTVKAKAAAEPPAPAATDASTPRLSEAAGGTQSAPIAQAAAGATGTVKAKATAEPPAPAASQSPNAADTTEPTSFASSAAPPAAVARDGDAPHRSAPDATTRAPAAVDRAEGEHAREADAQPQTADAPASSEAAPVQLGTVAGVPSTGAGSTRQIAAGIAHLAAQAAVVPSTAASAPRTIARTLTLKMSPADLGTVAIKMHMSGKALDVQLTMSDPRTAGLVERERGTLTALIADKSYELHSLVIQDGRGVSQPGVHHASQSDTFGGQPQTSQRGGDQGSRPDGQPRREPAREQAQRDSSGGARGRDREAVPDLRRGAFVV